MTQIIIKTMKLTQQPEGRLWNDWLKSSSQAATRDYSRPLVVTCESSKDLVMFLPYQKTCWISDKVRSQ